MAFRGDSEVECLGDELDSAIDLFRACVGTEETESAEVVTLSAERCGEGLFKRLGVVPIETKNRS
jgi:hypothetical protein